MDTTFKLNDVTERSIEKENFKTKEYTLKFLSDDNEEKSITLSGLGSLKDTIKI